MKADRVITLSTCVAVLSVAGIASAGPVLPYEFQVATDLSGLNADISLTAATDGTLIGNWDPVNNPTGTRTKPGLFGPFGPDENVPVPLSLGGTIGGPAQTSSSGSFGLAVDLVNNAVILTNYLMNFLNSGPLDLPASVTLDFDSFRTRNPTSIVPGIPVTLPIGAATVSKFSVMQVGPGVSGLLTPTGPNTYTFVTAPLV